MNFTIIICIISFYIGGMGLFIHLVQKLISVINKKPIPTQTSRIASITKPKIYLPLLAVSTLVFFITIKLVPKPTEQVVSAQKENNTSSQSTSNTDNSTSTFHCSVCGKLINGSGFEEVSNGVWKPCNYPYQCQICSPECGMKHTAEINNLIDKVEESTGAKCSACGMGKYINGFCNYCGAASQTTVNRHQDNYPVCNLCHGTGIEKPMGANSMGETGRVCPMCNGTGKDLNQSNKNNKLKNTESTINYKEIEVEIEQNMLKNKNVDKRIKEAIKKRQENRNSQ